jgi:hypothetical protein
MLKSILFIVLASVVSAMAAGCMPNADRGPVAFVPRTYQYVPELGPVDGK